MCPDLTALSLFRCSAMRSQSVWPVSSIRLTNMLEDALRRESEEWEEVFYSGQGSFEEMDVSSKMRDKAVAQLWTLSRTLRLSSESYILGVSLFDQVLSRIKVRSKYVYCVGVGCLSLAGKLVEDDDPELDSFVRWTEFSMCELKRMELAIASKMDWNLNPRTSLHFLHIFYFMVQSSNAASLPSLAPVEYRLINCLRHYQSASFAPSTLALAVLSVTLECCHPDWLTSVLHFLNEVKVDYATFIKCLRFVQKVCALPSEAVRLLPSDLVFLSCSLEKSGICTCARPTYADIVSGRHKAGLCEGSGDESCTSCASPASNKGVRVSALLVSAS